VGEEVGCGRGKLKVEKLQARRDKKQAAIAMRGGRREGRG
jgi:hypothetical protein